MGRKLNKVPDGTWKESLDESRARLAELTARGPRSDQPADLERWRHAVGERACDAGLILYQQEGDAREIRAYMKTAAEHLLAEHMGRGEPEPNTHRSPRLFEKTIDLVIAFGTPEQRGALPAVQPSQYRNPPYPDDDGLAQLIAILARYAADQTLDAEAYRTLEARLEMDQASRWDRAFYLPNARALRAAADADAKVWNDSISDLVTAHEDESRKGEYKKSELGLMCLPALAVAKLGMERGLTCLVRSEYFPLSLLEPGT
jgi:hypothetical protein